MIFLKQAQIIDNFQLGSACNYAIYFTYKVYNDSWFFFNKDICFR